MEPTWRSPFIPREIVADVNQRMKELQERKG